MELHRREYFIYRLMSGKINIECNDKKLIIVNPDSELKFEAQEHYINIYEQALNYNCLTDEDVLEHLIARGLWTEEKEKQLNKILPDHIEYWKVELYQSFLRSKTRETIRKYLTVAKNEYIRLHNIRNAYFTWTAHGIAAFARTQYILSRTTFYNNQLVDWNDFDIYQIMSLYHNKLLGNDDLRELARTSPWINIWVIHKKTGSKLFNNECLSDEQSFLMSWTITYDNIRESPDCPSDDIIEDDDMLDGWLIVQRRKRENERKKSEAENAITQNKRIQNAEEIFIVAETPEDAQKVDALNDMRGQMIKRQRMALIKEKGQVRQDEFQDIRQELQTQLNRMYSDKMRG